MNLSLQEKSLWVSVASVIIIFGYYFIYAFQILFDKSETNKIEILGLFIGILIFFIFVQVLFNILIGIFTRGRDTDERDRLIELKSTRIAYFVLAVGIWITISYSLIPIESLVNPLILAHILGFCFVVAEIVSYIAQLIYYRRGM